MRVERFQVDGLHGFIEADLSLLPELTIIVGRNGSGKTSVLDLMSKLLRLDIEELIKTQFSEANLKLVDEKLGEIFILARNKAPHCDIKITMGNSQTVVPLQMFRHLPRDEFRNVLFEARSEKLGAKVGEWKNKASSLRDAVRLTFVRLDRTILAIDVDGAESFESGALSRASRMARPATGGNKDPIDNVIEVMRRKYVQFRRTSNVIQRHATADLMKLHFAPATLPGKKATETQLRDTIKELRKRVNNSHLVASVPECASTISDFFKVFEQLLNAAYPKATLTTKRRAGRRTLEEETIEALIAIKNSQITELLRIFESEQERTSNAFIKIKKYLDILNLFLEDSGKTLFISPDTFDLSFSVSKMSKSKSNDSESSEISATDIQPIKDLSSGERQIIIVLTYLAFLAGNDSIFIVDEPELSLHVKWQRQIIDALRELRPDNCQIILATHAPEIATRARKSCVILSPRYLPGVDQQ